MTATRRLFFVNAWYVAYTSKRAQPTGLETALGSMVFAAWE
jgi:hypothetical protein